MRAHIILAALPSLGAAQPAPVPVQPAAPMLVSNPYLDERCPKTPMSLARQRKGPMVHRKLGDLPPAQTFMAVDRRVAGCPAPMLMREAKR